MYFGKNSNFENINAVGKSIVTRNKKIFNPEYAISVYQQYKNMNVEKCVLYSEQILSSYLYAEPSLMAERLTIVMGGFHPILVIREPCEWLESMYFFRLYNLKQDAVLGFENWLDSYNLNSGVRTDIYSLNYGVTAEVYRVASRQKNISVLFYEELKSDRDYFLKKFSNILSIDNVQTLELATRHIPSVHKDKLRINTMQAEFLWNCSLLYRGEMQKFKKIIDDKLNEISSSNVGEVAKQAIDRIRPANPS